MWIRIMLTICSVFVLIGPALTGERKRNIACDHHALDGFLCRLLGIETQVFEIGTGNSVFCSN